MIVSRSRCAMVFTLLLVSLPVAADVDVENGEADSFTLSAYARIRYSELGGALTVPNRTFGLESAGLTADFTVTDEVDGQLQVEVTTEQVSLKDCWLLWEPCRYGGLQAGYFKKPFCLNTLTSTWNLQSIDHSITHRELSDLLYSGRDLGAVVLADFRSDYLPDLYLGAFNGSSDPLNQDNELQYAARMEMDFPLNITLGADLTALRFGQPDMESVSGYIVSPRQMAYGADIQAEADVSDDLTLLVRGELVRGDNWADADVIHGVAAPSFQTWWTTAGMTWKTDAPSLDAVSIALSMASWKRDRTLTSREDEFTITLGLDTGSPVSVQLAAIGHRPVNIAGESNSTDYVAEITLDL